MSSASQPLAAAVAASCRTDLRDVAKLSDVYGTYRIGRVWQCIGTSGTPFHFVELVDATGTIRCHAWANRVPIVGELQSGSIVDVNFFAKQVDSRVYWKLNRASVVEVPSILDRFATVPATWCPVAGVVERIYRLIAAISRPALRGFLARVFAEEDQLRRFLSLPASWNDHHAYPGGLAEHSVEVAEATACIPMLQSHEREIAVVGALLHDVGKLSTMNGTPQAWSFWRLVQHDAFTLALLGPALAQLDVEWPDGAVGLRHIWTAASPGSRYGMPERSGMAIAVRCSDRISQETALCRVKLGNSSGFADLNRGRVIWVPGDVPAADRDFE